MPALPPAKTVGNPQACDWSDLLAKRQGAQSRRRELRGHGGLQMPHFTDDDTGLTGSGW